MTERVRLQGLYSPALKKVGCALLQAAAGGDKKITSIFSADDWFTSPQDDMIMISGTLEEWQRIEDMKRADRPGGKHFQEMVRQRQKTG